MAIVMGFSVTPELEQRLRAESKKSMSAVVRQALVEYYQRRELENSRELAKADR